MHEGAEAVHGHLTADTAYQERLVRFIENHDEPRAAATFPAGKARAAAVATLTQTGARLVHEGQLDGRARAAAGVSRTPARRAPDADLRAFYERLFEGLGDDVFRTGDLAARPARAVGTGTTRGRTCVAWGWRGDGPRKLVVVNLGDAPASGPRLAAVGRAARHGTGSSTTRRPARRYERSGDDLRDGLYVVARPVGLAPLRPDGTDPKD